MAATENPEWTRFRDGACAAAIRAMAARSNAGRFPRVLCGALLLAASLWCGRAAAQVVLSGQRNIYGAEPGLLAPPSPGGGGGGLFPLGEVFIENSAYGVQFTVSGLVSNDGNLEHGNGPDGGMTGTSTDVQSFGHLSGIRHGSRTMFLVGVFLPYQSVLSDPAPPTLDFSAGSIGTRFTALFPRMQQVFFIGDGLDASGQRQTFYPPWPPTYTVLSIGFADASDGHTVSGPPGDYADNVGSLSVLTVAVPRPLCGSSDYNHDGAFGTDADVEAFFACIAGDCCPTCSSADFDGDGDTATDADIEAFFRVLAGGSC